MWAVSDVFKHRRAISGVGLTPRMATKARARMDLREGMVAMISEKRSSLRHLLTINGRGRSEQVLISYSKLCRIAPRS